MDDQNYIENVVSEIEQLELKIEFAQQTIAESKQRIQQIATDAIVNSDGETRRLLSWRLYWFYSKSVFSKTIAYALGVSVQKLISIIGDAVANTHCFDCKAPIQVKVSSREDFKQLNSNSWNRKRCESCSTLNQREELKSRNLMLTKIQARQDRLDRLRTMPYREYLQTEEWNTTRTRKLKRARFRCELCNKQGRLNVHHKTYERRGDEHDGDLIVLCETCHAKFHDKLPQEQ